MTDASVCPRRSPVQARAKATSATLVEAAARILEAEVRAALTTNRIAERAGAGVRSLYQYFGAKAALVAALIRRERVLRLDDVQAVARRRLMR